MKILHVIRGKANKHRANGVNQVVAGLAKYCARHGAEIKVIGVSRTPNDEQLYIKRDGFSVSVISKVGSRFNIALGKAIEWADVVHIHGTYSPLNAWISAMCKSRRKPYVVTLHGGLSRELALLKGRFQ